MSVVGAVQETLDFLGHITVGGPLGVRPGIGLDGRRLEGERLGQRQLIEHEVIGQPWVTPQQSGDEMQPPAEPVFGSAGGAVKTVPSPVGRAS